MDVDNDEEEDMLMKMVLDLLHLIHGMLEMRSDNRTTSGLDDDCYPDHHLQWLIQISIHYYRHLCVH